MFLLLRSYTTTTTTWFLGSFVCSVAVLPKPPKPPPAQSHYSQVEYNLLVRMAPPSKDSYAKLLPMQQLEIFEMIMSKTSGMDLARVMHQHSQSNWQVRDAFMGG